MTGGLGARRAGARRTSPPSASRTAEMRPGCYDPKARLPRHERGRHSRQPQLSLVPPLLRSDVFWEAKDKELALICVKAYNDWMIDEWCGTDPGRYIPLGIIPLWDTQLAVEEVERIHAKGVNSICFSENFEPLGLPTILTPAYWEPVLRPQRMEIVLSIHIGSSSTCPSHLGRLSVHGQLLAGHDPARRGSDGRGSSAASFSVSRTSRSRCPRAPSGGSHGCSNAPTRFGPRNALGREGSCPWERRPGAGHDIDDRPREDQRLPATTASTSTAASSTT